MSVKDIFENMDYGTAPESAAQAQAWIRSFDGKFGHYINGEFTPAGALFDTNNPATGETLAQITQATEQDVDAAVKAAQKAQTGWSKLSGHNRAKPLYALARLIQKHARLFSVLETLDNGKPIRESRDIDIPLVSRHFYYHAGMAQLQDVELPDREALGVCGQIIPWNFPLLMLAWKIAPAIAMGNTVVLKPAQYTSLTALLFAQICDEAGLPKGVVNIVTGDGAVGETIVNHEGIDKIAFTGSTQVGRMIRQSTAGSGKALTLELGGKSPYIVFDDADLDSAVEGLVDAIWFNQGQVCCAGSRLLVQESIAERFYTKLKARMNKLRLGDPMDKSIDIGAIVDPSQHKRISDMVDNCAHEGDLFQSSCAIPEHGCFYPPTLITALSTSSTLMQEEIFGPVLAATTFRTQSEAVMIANNTRYGLAATIWSENVNLTLDIAPKLSAGVVWINGTNMLDAAAGFGGTRESGFGREGGWEGLRAYTKARRKPRNINTTFAIEAPKKSKTEGLDRTAKLYIGGKQARPDSGYSHPVWSKNGTLLGHVGNGSRKDIRNAVEASNSAASWGKTTGHLRAQILYYIAENLSARSDEFATRIDDMMGAHNGAKEVDAAINCLFTYAAWADKNDGKVKSVPMRAIAMTINEPIGIIGAFCPNEAPLLGLISLMAPAIAMGNRVILVPSAAFPLSATDFYQVLDTSDVPAGVVNIITGTHLELAAPMAGHMGVDAVWSHSDADISHIVEHESTGNLKRTWVNNNQGRDWLSVTSDAREFISEACETKTIWVPYGE